MNLDEASSSTQAGIRSHQNLSVTIIRYLTTGAGPDEIFYILVI